jgi:Tfp pilus assembly protein PilO
MNAITMPMLTRSGTSQRAFPPIETWSRRRMLATAVGVAALVFVLGVQAWRTAAPIDVDTSRSALVATQAKVAQTRRLVAELPALRMHAASGDSLPEQWTGADALHEIARVASQSGLRVTEIEPMPPEQSGATAAKAASPVRTLRFRADGDFGAMQRFLDALAGLPRLVVPERTQMKRQANALSIDTTLRVFETLPAVPPAVVIAAPRADAFVVDPFGRDVAGGIARGADLLLVGTIVGFRRSMALVQNGPGVEGFVSGEKIGDERLGRIAPRAIELAGDDGASRSLSFADVRDTGSFARVPSFDIATNDSEPARRSAKRRVTPDDSGADVRVKPKRTKTRKVEDARAADGIPRYSIFDTSRKLVKASRKADSTGDGK